MGNKRLGVDGELLRGHLGRRRLRRPLPCWVEPKPADLVLEVAGRKVSVDFRRDAGVLVTEDSLDGRGVGPRHHEQARSGVAKIVEPDVAHLGLGPEKVAVLGAAARRGVVGFLLVAAPLLAADVHVVPPTRMGLGRAWKFVTCLRHSRAPSLRMRCRRIGTTAEA
jgi:hypothetical protein